MRGASRLALTRRHDSMYAFAPVEERRASYEAWRPWHLPHDVPTLVADAVARAADDDKVAASNWAE